ncbi:MAG: hypothetical protein RIG84_07255 [Roseovarius sp.]
MTLSELLSHAAFPEVATYILSRAAGKDETERLREAALTGEAFADTDELEAQFEKLDSASEAGDRLNLAEKIAAHLARSVLRAQVKAELGELPGEQNRWVGANIQAHTVIMHRARAILLDSAGMGDAHDATIATHAFRSALQAQTIQPVPGPEPETDPDTITVTAPEDTMLPDPTDLRKKILEHAKFNLAGLPAALRNAEAQAIYLDAVIQGVTLLGHRPSEEDTILWATAATGMLLVDGHYDCKDQRFFRHVQRAVAELSSSATEDSRVQIDSHGDDMQMFAPHPEKTQKIAIFAKVMKLLSANKRKGEKIFLQSLAATARKMIDRYSDHEGDIDHLESMSNSAYDIHVSDSSGGGGRGDGVANVDLPPLHDPHGYQDEIEPNNIRAVSTIYVSYQLEFAITACMRCVDLFTAGLLAINASDGNVREIDNLAWDREDFLDEAQRRSVQSRVLGAPGGELAFGQQPNSEFNTLLMRVVSAVSEFEREQNVLTHFDNASRGRRYQSTSGEFVRKAVRDFAANASLRGWAGTAFTAERLARQIKRVMMVLNLPALKNALGVTTGWQVCERIMQREYGVNVNTVLHRTLGVETQRIMGIIADNHTIWSSGVTGRPLFSTDREEGDLSLRETRELMVACQHFRAVNGVNDTMLSEYAEPEVLPATPSLPDFGMGAMGGMGGGMQGGMGGMGGIDMAGLNQLREMASSGQTPSPDQILALVPKLN